MIAATIPENPGLEEEQIRSSLRLDGRSLLVGVDRMDYIKGIPERFHAVDRLLSLHPELKGTFHLVQLGAPSRTRIHTYRRLKEEVEGLAEEINWRHGNEVWKPIVHIAEHYEQPRVYALYRMAAACVVSSLHDGMNLVAKEFVASRTDLRGALILSRFTGAAREFTDALQFNPYAVDELAQAMRQALLMSPEEQQRRMSRMRQQVIDNNIYRWAGMLLSHAGKLFESSHDEFEPRAAASVRDLPWKNHAASATSARFG
jgi:trehalose 6-phosphate synthase